MDYQITIIASIHTSNETNLQEAAREVCDMIQEHTRFRNPYVEVRVMMPVENKDEFDK